MLLFLDPSGVEHEQLGTMKGTQESSKEALDPFDDQYSHFKSECLGFIDSEDSFLINAQPQPEGKRVIANRDTNISDYKLPMTMFGSSTSISMANHTSRIQRKWDIEEDQVLYDLHHRLNGRWQDIAAKMKGRNASQCSQRWRRLHPATQHTPSWSYHEDQLLIKLVARHGRQWKKIALEFDDKSEKQVMMRFVNKLDRVIRTTPWTEEEDQLILDQYYQIGSKWAKISKQLNGRPANAVKNRFYSHIRRVHLGQPNPYFIITEM